MRGVIDELDPAGGFLTLRVVSGARAGRRLIGRTVRVDATEARFDVPDADGDRSRSLRDAFPGNDVQVRFTADAPLGEGEPLLRASRLTHHGPDMPVGGLRRLWR